MKNKYVVFDGMDGTGKGTQIDLLKAKLRLSVLFTREPGGTPFAEEIRKVVRDNPLAGKSTALNNFLLFWAAREDLLQNLIVPALQTKHVFSDRGDSSTYAFQLWGEEHRELLGLFKLLRKRVFDRNVGRRQPNLYIVFDLAAEVARERVMKANRGDLNHFDARDLAYYERVREGFHSFAKFNKVEFIDATQSPEEVHQSVLEVLAKNGIKIMSTREFFG